MTEAEWLTSSDPVAMLRHLTHADARDHDAIGQDLPPLASDRKLRHIACAQWLELKRQYHYNESPESRAIAFRCLSYVQRAADGEIPLTDAVGLVVKERLVETWHLLNADPREAILKMMGGKIPTEHILRDIIGNPFRPVTLPLGEMCSLCKGRGRILYDKRSREPAIYRASSGKPYSSMSDLAEAECGACCGTGHRPSPVLTPLVVSLAEPAYTQRQPDGTLYDDALAVLWDALEEAGCPGDDGKCRGKCSRDGYPGRYSNDTMGLQWWDCPDCNGTGRQSHPLRAALLSPGPHYPGMAALDVLLNKE